MRVILTILFLKVSVANATKRYVANSGSDAANGLTAGTAWQTLAKANASIVAGDTLVLNCGDTWNEKLNLVTGTISNPIYVSYYGTGSKPLITGFNTLTGWTNIGNVWSSTFTNSVSYQNTVYINGALRGKGRYPNYGWLTFTSHSGLNQITGSLTGTPNYTGGEVMIRNVRWQINRQYITAQSGGAITFTPNSYYALNDNWGYFIANIPSVLDTANEWCIDTTNKVIKVYAGSQPTAKASSIDTLVNCASKSYITFDGLQFDGANLMAFDVSNSNHISINNCDIHDCGTDGIKGKSTYYLCVTNSTFTNLFNDAMILLDFTAVSNFSDSYGLYFANNTLYNIGMIGGMNKTGNQAKTAVDYFGKSGYIYNNSITNTGYAPILFQGDSTVVRNNYVDTFCVTTDDGAGIYTNGVNGKWYKGCKIVSNIVVHGIGAPDGTPSPTDNTWTFGIYEDDYSHNIIADSNTVGYCRGSGFILHDGDSATIRYNTFAYNGTVAGTSQMRFTNLSGGNCYITNNINYADSTQYVIDMAAFNIPMAIFGTMDTNYYSKPQNDSNIVKYGSVYKSLYQWQDSGKDIHSKGTPANITSAKPLFVYNKTNKLKAVSLDGTYIDIKLNEYTGYLFLNPFTSALLYKKTTNSPANTGQKLTTSRFLKINSL